MSKKNPNLCTTHESLTKGENSLYRISGLYEGKARVCVIMPTKFRRVFKARTVGGKVTGDRAFHIDKVTKGDINIMCIERGE